MTRSQTIARTCVRIFRANQALRLLAVFVLLLLAIAVVIGLTTSSLLGGYKGEVARLRNDMAAIEKNQAIVIVGGGSNRVDAIIAPN